MPVLHQGDLTIFTPSQEAQLKMQEFERKAIQENMIVDQHTASSLIEQKERDTNKPGYLKIYKLMKLIAAGGGATPVPKEEMQMHSASTANNTATTNNNNLVILNLMKRITNGPRF